jgi:hypothetical protein
MKVVLRALVLTGSVTSLVLAGGGVAIAGGNPAGTGQPGASCQDFQATPTSPLLVNGFNTAGFARAGSVYAGSDGTASLAHANSDKAVSQYDVACYQLSQH